MVDMALGNWDSNQPRNPLIPAKDVLVVVVCCGGGVHLDGLVHVVLEDMEGEVCGGKWCVFVAGFCRGILAWKEDTFIKPPK